jgi:hypothetical protein
MDGQRSRGGHRRGSAAVDAGVLLAVLHGLGAVRDLRGQWANVLFAHGDELTLRGTHGEPAASAVVADAIILGRPRNVPVVNVTHPARVDIVYGAVVHEAIMVPVAAVEAGAGVSVAVGNAAIKADV